MVEELELWQVRTIHFLLSLLNIFFIYKIAHHFQSDKGYWTVLEICLLPIIFPYFLMVYTDLLSLLFVLASFYLVLKKQYLFSATLLSISICIRQPNIIWGAFIAIYIFVEQYKGRFNWKSIRSYLLNTWSFIFLEILFVAFVYWNEGVAMGDKEFHPLNRLRLSNIIFALYVFFILFLPLHILILR